MILAIILFCISIFVVVKSAELFLNITEKIGVYYKIHSFILGVVLVGFGTSLPELTTSIASVAGGEYGLTLPNVIGSNIANILLIIGISTVLLGTIKYEKDLVDIDLPLLVSTTFLFGLLAVDGTVTRLDGALLLISFFGYIVYSLYYNENEEYHRGLTKLIFALSNSRQQSNSHTHKNTADKPELKSYAFLIVAIIALAAASKNAVDNLVVITDGLNIPVGVGSFFALAIGTSLPELVVSLKALQKGQGDVLVGNIIGSSMFNLLLIGGASSLLHEQVLPSDKGPWMLAGLVVATTTLMVSGITKRIHIWEGAAFVLLYIAITFHIL